MLKSMASRTQFADAEFERALKVSLESFPHIRGLNEEQICCLQSVAIKLDVFGILPTGFGKSLIFQLLPRLLKEMWNLERSTVVLRSVDGPTQLLQFANRFVIKPSMVP